MGGQATRWRQTSTNVHGCSQKESWVLSQSSSCGVPSAKVPSEQKGTNGPHS